MALHRPEVVAVHQVVLKFKHKHKQSFQSSFFKKNIFPRIHFSLSRITFWFLFRISFRFKIHWRSFQSESHMQTILFYNISLIQGISISTIVQTTPNYVQLYQFRTSKESNIEWVKNEASAMSDEIYWLPFVTIHLWLWFSIDKTKKPLREFIENALVTRANPSSQISFSHESIEIDFWKR